MALRMICADARLFAAVALLAGAMPEMLGANCRPRKTIAVLMINGTADQAVPYAGGAAQPGSALKAWPAERQISSGGAMVSTRSKGHQTTQITGPGVERWGDTQPRGIAVLMLTMCSNFESRSIGFWPEDIKEFVLRPKD